MLIISNSWHWFANFQDRLTVVVQRVLEWVPRSFRSRTNTPGHQQLFPSLLWCKWVRQYWPNVLVSGPIDCVHQWGLCSLRCFIRFRNLIRLKWLFVEDHFCLDSHDPWTFLRSCRYCELEPSCLGSYLNLKKPGPMLLFFCWWDSINWFSRH